MRHTIKWLILIHSVLFGVCLQFKMGKNAFEGNSIPFQYNKMLITMSTKDYMANNNEWMNILSNTPNMTLLQITFRNESKISFLHLINFVF